MRKSKMARIEAELMRLQEGDLATPVKVDGVGISHTILKRLETLRLTMLKMQDNTIEADKRINTAIASVAHDMKTPLSVISGYAECLSDGMNDKDYPSLILQKTEQMNEMVLSIVEDSHKSLEQQNSVKQAVNAKVYFKEAIDRMRPLADAKNITIIAKKAPEARLRLDSYKFGRVMQNLITNAVKYSPSGSTIKITFKRWAKTLRISVKDNGDGIAKESLPYIFDQFYKEDKTRADTSSSGLGLYITREIVREHGGKIFVISRKGKGSVFTIVLPVEPDLDEKLTLTGKFDRLPLWAKLMTDFVFGWLLAAAYRLTRYVETRNISTLLFGTLCIFLFPFVWMEDFLSICVYGRIAFLAD